MLSKIKIISFLFVFHCFLFSIFFLLPFRSKDFTNYLAFKKQSEEHLSNKKTSHDSKEYKKNVTRDIWYNKNGERLQYHMQCKDATLTFSPKDDHLDINETMYGVTSWLQDRFIIDPETKEMHQQVHYLWADEGNYRYNQKAFAAQKVDLILYRTAGTTLPTTPPQNEEIYLQGLAKEVRFSLKNQMDFHAHQFKANVKSSKKH